MKLGMVGLGRMGGEHGRPAPRARTRGRRLLAEPTVGCRHARGTRRRARATARRLVDGSGRRADRGDDRRARRRCSRRATSSSTAATRTTATRYVAPTLLGERRIRSSTPASAAASGDARTATASWWAATTDAVALAAAGLRRPRAGRRLRARRTGRGPVTSRRWCTTGSSTDLMQSFARGLRAAARVRARHRCPGARSPHGGRGASCGRGCSTCSSMRLKEDPDLDGLRGYAEDSGEGRWTVQEAVRLGVPVPAISAALYARFASRQDDSLAMKVIAALRRALRRPRDRDVRSDGASERTRSSSSARRAISRSGRSIPALHELERRGRLGIPSSVSRARTWDDDELRRYARRVDGGVRAARIRRRSVRADRAAAHATCEASTTMRRRIDGCARRSATRSIRSRISPCRRACSRT